MKASTPEKYPGILFRCAKAVQGDQPPKGAVWMHEIKFDGYRMQIHKDGQKIWLFTHNGQDWTDRFPQLASDLAALQPASLTRNWWQPRRAALPPRSGAS